VLSADLQAHNQNAGAILPWSSSFSSFPGPRDPPLLVIINTDKGATVACRAHHGP